MGWNEHMASGECSCWGDREGFFLWLTPCQCFLFVWFSHLETSTMSPPWVLLVVCLTRQSVTGDVLARKCLVVCLWDQFCVEEMHRTTSALAVKAA